MWDSRAGVLSEGDPVFDTHVNVVAQTQNETIFSKTTQNIEKQKKVMIENLKTCNYDIPLSAMI